MSKNPKIVDCFIFYNELKMLYYRLDILYNYVDYFVLVEAKYTHTNNPKELYYEKNKHLFRKFNDKIIHVVVDSFPATSKNNWDRENYQRNYINEGIKCLSLCDDDLIIISDIDEIPNPNIFKDIINYQKESHNVYSLNQDMYYYDLNRKTSEEWIAAEIIPYYLYRTVFNSKPQPIRYYKGIIIQNGGWHLSYFGDAEYIKNKLENFTHTELLDGVNNNLETIKYRLKNNLDVCGRGDKFKLEYIDLKDNINLPPNYEKLVALFS